MRRLTVLYDASCNLCRSACRWLRLQPKFVALEFVPAASAEAVRRYPELDPADCLREITVIADDGGVYRGARAWVMCLWALRGYRGFALTLSRPALYPRARRFVAFVARNRKAFQA